MKDTDALALLLIPPEDVAAHQSITCPDGSKDVIVHFTIPDDDYRRLQSRAHDTARIIRALDRLDPDELPTVLWEIQNKFVVT